MNDLTKNILVFIVIIVVLLSVVQGLSGVSGPPPEKVDYSEFLSQVKSGNVQRVEFEGKRINFGNRLPLSQYTISPETDNNTLIGLLEENNVRFTAEEPESQSLIGQLLISSFPILLLIGVWIYFMRQMQGGGGGRGAMTFGKSKARLLGEDQVSVSFADVAGLRARRPEAKSPAPPPGPRGTSYACVRRWLRDCSCLRCTRHCVEPRPVTMTPARTGYPPDDRRH